jgi:hypothetical protein
MFQDSPTSVPAPGGIACARIFCINEEVPSISLPKSLSKQDRLDLAAAIRADGPDRVVEALWSIVETSKNDAAKVAALSLLASHGWGRPRQDIKIEHQSTGERRKVFELLADRAPHLLREIAGWEEPPALPAGEVVDAEVVA